MAQGYKFGDILRHNFINKTTDLIVLSATDTSVTVRYVAQDRFHTEVFVHDEVDFKQKLKPARAHF